MSLLLLLLACDQPVAVPVPEPASGAPASAPALQPAGAMIAEWEGLADDGARHAWLMEEGAKVYQTGGGGLACGSCHAADGMGTKGAFPPLVGQREHMGDCAQSASYVLDGLSGAIEVDGITYNGVMVPQAGMLNDHQIAAVLTYVRNSWGNDYGDCAPDQVAAVRTPKD